MQQSLAKNTTFLTAAFTFQKILSFFYFTAVARNLGEVNLGKYGFALIFTSIFVIFMDFGLGPILTREGAKDERTLGENLRRIIALKIVLTFFSLIALFLTLWMYQYIKPMPEDTKFLTYLATSIIVLDTFTFTFFSVFRAKQHLQYEALGIMIYQALIVSAGTIVLYFRFPLYALILAILLGSLFQCIYSLLLVERKAKLSVLPNFNFRTFKKFIRLGAPFALAGIFFKLNGSIDTVMLHGIAGERFVGWYLVALKLTTALTVLPGAFATGFFPAMSHYYQHAREKMSALFEHSMFYLMVISLPITFGVLVIADKIILTVYGPAFEASIQALQIFISSLLFVFLNYPVGNLLNAADKQTRNTIHMGIALLVNVLLNFVLIPKYTYIGASVAALIAHIVLICLGLPVVYRIVHFRVRYLVNKLIRVLTAAGIMGIFLFVVEPYFQFSLGLLFLIIVGAIVYGLALFLVRAFSFEELRFLYAAVLRKKTV